jgi:hypothetical protein
MVAARDEPSSVAWIHAARTETSKEASWPSLVPIANPPATTQPPTRIGIVWQAAIPRVRTILLTCWRPAIGRSLSWLAIRQQFLVD